MHLTRRWECCAGARWRRLIINTNKSFPDTLVLLLLPPLSLLNPEPRRKAELERLKELKCPGGGGRRGSEHPEQLLPLVTLRGEGGEEGKGKHRSSEASRVSPKSSSLGFQPPSKCRACPLGVGLFWVLFLWGKSFFHPETHPSPLPCKHGQCHFPVLRLVLRQPLRGTNWG